MGSLEVMRKISVNPSVEQTFALALNNPLKKDLAMMNLSHIITNIKGIDGLEPVSVANAVVAMTNLGFAASTGESYVIPYGGKATFQIGYKGWIQLAERSQKIKHINADAVYEGQYLGKNKLTGEIRLDGNVPDGEDKDIIGYFAYLETTGGFEKTIYMTVEEMHQHFCKFSKNNYDEVNRQWMESKKYKKVSRILDVKKKSKITMLKQIISTWAPKDATLEMALANDGKVFDKDGNGSFEIENKPEADKRTPANKEVILAVLKQLSKVVIAKHPTLDNKTVWPEMNKLGKSAGINFNVSNGWYGITMDELKALAIVSKKEYQVELTSNGVILSQDQSESEKDKEYDIND